MRHPPGVTIVAAALAVFSVGGTGASAEEIDETRIALQVAPAQSYAQGLIVRQTQASERSRTLNLNTRNELLNRLGITSELTARVMGSGELVLSFAEAQPLDQAQQAADELMLSGEFAFAEPDLILQHTTDRAAPNDPQYESQWHLEDGGGASDYSIDAPSGWRVTLGSPDVVVAVLDTGFTDHPDLENRVINGFDFISDRRVANDGDGRDSDARDPGDWIDRADQVSGFSNCSLSDSSWHGTHVAGIIAARQGNGVGVSGVAPDVKVLAIRVLGKCGGTTSDIADGIRWAAGGSIPGVPRNPNPADVINLSLGGPAPCMSTLRNAIDFALSRGVTVVVAAGNESSPISNSVPANCPGVVSVVASNTSGKRTSWSNYGTSRLRATITAPGESTLSTLNAGRRDPGRPIFARSSGTSMAAPVVSGAVALLKSLGVAQGEVSEALLNLAKAFGSRGSGSPCNRTSCGFGLLSLKDLSDYSEELPDSPEPEPDPQPEPEAPIGPTPLSIPGLITGMEQNCNSVKRTARCTISWQEAKDSQRVLFYEYRIKRGDRRWLKWNPVSDRKVRVAKLPLAAMSFVEVRGVNEAGRGAVYQVALYPR